MADQLRLDCMIVGVAAERIPAVVGASGEDARACREASTNAGAPLEQVARLWQVAMRFWMITMITSIVFSFVVLIVLGAILGRSSAPPTIVACVFLGLGIFAGSEFGIATSRRLALFDAQRGRKGFFDHRPAAWDFWGAAVFGLLIFLVVLGSVLD